MMVWSLFIIGLMGLFFYNKIGSIIPKVILPTTEIIEHKLIAEALLEHETLDSVQIKSLYETGHMPAAKSDNEELHPLSYDEVKSKLD